MLVGVGTVHNARAVGPPCPPLEDLGDTHERFAGHALDKVRATRTR